MPFTPEELAELQKMTALAIKEALPTIVSGVTEQVVSQVGESNRQQLDGVIGKLKGKVIPEAIAAAIDPLQKDITQLSTLKDEISKNQSSGSEGEQPKDSPPTNTKKKGKAGEEDPEIVSLRQQVEALTNETASARKAYQEEAAKARQQRAESALFQQFQGLLTSSDKEKAIKLQEGVNGEDVLGFLKYKGILQLGESGDSYYVATKAEYGGEIELKPLDIALPSVIKQNAAHWLTSGRMGEGADLQPATTPSPSPSPSTGSSLLDNFQETGDSAQLMEFYEKNRGKLLEALE